MRMWFRGPQRFRARTTTSALHGLVCDHPRTLQEFLAFARGDASFGHRPRSMPEKIGVQLLCEAQAVCPEVSKF